MMPKKIFSISMGALLLAVVAFAALETWIEVRARESHYETFSLEDPARASNVRGGAEASKNH